MPYQIRFEADKCVACGTCAIACMDQCDIKIGRDVPFRRVLTKERKMDQVLSIQYLSVGCMHCSNAVCITACSVHCYHRDQETGLVLLDNQACIGCRKCGKSCPLQAIGFGESGRASKCNGCRERLVLGLRPACEKACQNAAIHFEFVPDGETESMDEIDRLAKLLDGNEVFRKGTTGLE